MFDDAPATELLILVLVFVLCALKIENKSQFPGLLYQFNEAGNNPFHLSTGSNSRDCPREERTKEINSVDTCHYGGDGARLEHL